MRVVSFTEDLSYDEITIGNFTPPKHHEIESLLCDIQNSPTTQQLLQEKFTQYSKNVKNQTHQQSKKRKNTNNNNKHKRHCTTNKSHNTQSHQPEQLQDQTSWDYILDELLSGN